MRQPIFMKAKIKWIYLMGFVRSEYEMYKKLAKY